VWLHLPTSAYSPEQPASTSLSDSLCQALAASATWRTKSLPPKSWQLALRKGRLMTRLSGLTCEASQANSIVGEWMESLEDSPALIFPSPEDRKESPERKAGSGLNTCDSFAKFNRDGSLSKTYLAYSLWEMDEPYSEDLPKQGSMRSGSLYQRPEWVPAISGSECSSSLGATWPTPNLGMLGSDRANDEALMRDGERHQIHLSHAARAWPTPTAEDAEQCGGRPSGYNSLNACLNLWSTPNVPNGGRTLSPEDVINRGKTAKGKRQVGLENEASIWNTPTSDDSKGTDDGPKSMARREAGEMNTSDMRLRNQVAAWATPSARDWKSGEASQETLDKNSRPLNEQALLFQSSPPAPKRSPGTICFCGTHGCGLPSHKRKLNPIFVAWLMGWPIWWCAKEPMPYALPAMESWLSQARRHLSYLLRELD
jgi:hypothetical protein